MAGAIFSSWGLVVRRPTRAAKPFARRSRLLSTSTHLHSRVGKASVTIPPNVTITELPTPPPPKGYTVEQDKLFEITGPLGQLELPMTSFMKVSQDLQTREATLEVADPEDKYQRAMWGTMRAYLNNAVLGVSEGHTAILRLVGVGYRASIEKTAITVKPEYEGQEFVSLKVGYSHPIELPIPLGVKASCPQPTRILLECPDKEVLGQFAAEIRKWRVPEPYKGKGIFVNNETIKLKAKKIK